MSIKRTLLNLILNLVVFGLFQATSAKAAELKIEDIASFQRIINAQIEAFKTGDAKSAYSFAAPSVKNLFSSPQSFINMVRRGYRPVYRPQSFKFGSVTNELGRPTQRVNVVGPEGLLWVALYGFERQKDGVWKISGVLLFQPGGFDA